MISEGRYEVKTVGAELAEAGTGTKQVAVHFEIEDGEEAGKTITWFGFLTDAALPYTLKTLRMLGFKGNNIAKIEEQELGNASITVKHDEWDGEVRAKVEWVNEPGSSGMVLKPIANKDKFAKAMAAKIKALEAGNEKAAAEALGDDDVPFDV